jgi:hypothetical protein
MKRAGGVAQVIEWKNKEDREKEKGKELQPFLWDQWQMVMQIQAFPDG